MPEDPLSFFTTMDPALLMAAGASFLAGLFGYIIAKMWIKPIVRYNTLKHRLDRELASSMGGATDAGAARPLRIDAAQLRAARQTAMALVSSFNADLPPWYRIFLASRLESPAEASGLMTNLAKIGDPAQVAGRINLVREKLRLK